ncbi:MAG: ABC-2 family transporter protein [Propionibacteriaceae bacterium]|nr:ABC-2 family transporter protein [Propionibacteriaceae bacterium]
MAWRTYSLLLSAGFRRQSRYRLAMFAGLTTNAVFGMIRASVLGGAAVAAGGSLAGYSVGEMMTYVWLGQGLLGSVNLWGRTDLTDRVRTGDIAVDYARPVSVVGAYLAADLGAALYVLVPRGLPALAIGWVTFGLSFSTDPLNWALAPVSVVAAIVTAQLMVYAVALLGFWLVETRGFIAAYATVSSFFAGLVVPVWLMPEWLRAVAHLTPWPSMLQTPLDIMSGRLGGGHAAAAFGTQVLWLGLVAAAVSALAHAGRRRLEVQGG